MKNLIKHLGEGIASGLLLVAGIITKQDIFFIAAILAGGIHQLVHGFQDMIESKSLNIDLLMVLAAIGTVFIGHPQEGATLIFIFSFAHGLEHATMDKSKREIESLMNLQPQTANRLNESGDIEVVSVDQISIGNVLLVKVAETVPIDGVIVEGDTSLEEAMITGESMPKDKTIDDRVFGGTVNISKPIKIKVDTDINDTMINKIVRMVNDSQNFPSKVGRKIDNFEKTYSNIVVLFALLVILFNIFILDVAKVDAFYKGITLLVVASPCALAASVTPATLAAISRLAKNGVLVKGGVHLENMASIKAVAFDKTGTLTKGKPSLIEWQFKEKKDEKYLAVYKTIEKHSNHPLALAIVDGINDKAVANSELHNVVETPGCGLSADYKGDTYFIGRQKDKGKKWNTKEVIEKENEGKTISFLYKNDIEIGYLVLKDEIREESKEMITYLKSIGVTPVLITGDNLITAKEVSKELGIDRFYSEVLPNEKSNIVIDLEKEYGLTAMVGDGVNDAPALANSTVGIAMGGGTDIAMETADIVFVNNDISNVAETFETSFKLNKLVKQNIIISMTVILLLVLTTLFGDLALPMGVIGHEGSTILVIMNGLRVLKKDKQ